MELAFDSHAHWNDPQFDADRDILLPALPRAGIGTVMNVGCCLASSRDCIKLAEKYPHIYAAVGTHPQDAREWCPEAAEQYRQMAKHPKVMAIGEIGLDYYFENISRETQKQAFRGQLQLAREVQLPVIIHERSAHGDALDIIREFPDVHGVFHCFSGSKEMALELVRRGWYIGFTGVLTFQNARKSVEAAKAVPLNRILIETDCPSMAPEPNRGLRCDSRMVLLTAAKLGELRGISAEEALKITRENARCLFGIEE